MPQVTVILTSYNHAKYLRESIESVLHQSFSDFELIIGDDASTDESWDIIQSYTDHRIHAYRHEISKGGGVINELVLSGKISSDYVAIHHSDDIWEPQKLEKQVAFLEKNPQTGAVFSNALIIGENGQPFKDRSHFYYSIFDQPNRDRYEWLNYFFYHGNALCHSSVLIRKQCYDDCGIYRYGLAQIGDFDMWVRLCLKYEIHIIPEKLVRFRVRSNEMNSSADRPEARIRGQFEFFEMYNNYRDIKSPEELIRIFPTAEKYFNTEGFDIGFALGMVALEPETFNTAKLFGLNLLFEALNDPDRARKVNELYQFRHSNFVALAGEQDVFSVKSIGRLNQTLVERDEQLARRNDQIAYLEKDIWVLSTNLAQTYSSRSWRLMAPLRWIGGQSRRVIWWFKVLLAMFSHFGGLFPFIRIIIRVWRKDGLAGIKVLADQYMEKSAAAASALPSSESPAVSSTPATLSSEIAMSDKPLRPEILFVSHEATRTGAPIFLLSLLRFLSNRLDVDFVILLRSGGELEHEFRALGTTIVLANRDKLDPRVLQALKRRKIKLIYSNTITNGMVQTQLKGLGIPILCHVHELAFSIKTYFGEESIKRVLDTTTMFMAGSEAVANDLSSQLHVKKEYITLAYPFIKIQENLQAVKNSRQPLDLPQNTVVVGACGSISWRKGTDLFIQVARLVLEKTNMHVMFVWLGGPLSYGDYRNLHHDAILTGIDNDIIFTGNVASHLPYFAQFDIFVLPSREDPFPLVALDAASIGIPIVCFEQAGGTPELVEDDAGIVVPYLDVEQMAEAIKQLVEDNALRKRLGKRAHQKVEEHYDATVGGEHIVEIIKTYL